MDELVCLESARECRAAVDPILVEDDRVLHNLLRMEERYLINSKLFECVQRNEITPDNRRTVAEWMLEVCEELRCQSDVFSLAMSYLDRFLSVCRIRRSAFQIVGSTCLLIASKVRETCPISPDKLVFYAANSFKLDDLWVWELLILSKLKWEVSTVTPHDFIRPLLRRIPVEESDVDCTVLFRHAHTFMALCAREFQFSNFTPSIIASASLAASLQGLEWTAKTGCSLPQLIDRLCQLTGVEGEYLGNCWQRIENMVQDVMASRDSASGNYYAGEETSVPPQSALQMTVDKLDDSNIASTPTDVRDVHFP